MAQGTPSWLIACCIKNIVSWNVNKANLRSINQTSISGYKILIFFQTYMQSIPLRSKSIDLKTVSIGTMTAQQPSTLTQMSPQVQLRVILLFYNLCCEVIFCEYNFLKLLYFNFMIYFSATKLEISVSFYSSISFKK